MSYRISSIHHFNIFFANLICLSRFCWINVIILNIAYYEVCQYGIKKRKNPIGITFRWIGTSYSKQIPIHPLASCEWVLHYALAFLFIIYNKCICCKLWTKIKVKIPEVNEMLTRRMRASEKRFFYFYYDIMDRH